MNKLLLACAAAAFAACNPTFSAPVRTTHHGAPGALSPAQGSVYASGAAGGVRRGTLGVTIPVSDNLRLELGADGSEVSATGRGGVRYTHVNGRAAFDGEAGFGAGVGGSLCGNATNTRQECPVGSDPAARLYPDGRDAWQRLTFGGYGGVGLGVRPWRWVELYTRGGLQMTRSLGVPTTLWVTGVGGAQFGLGPVDLHAAFGWTAYFNERDTANGPTLEVGVTVPLTMRRP